MSVLPIPLSNVCPTNTIVQCLFYQYHCPMSVLPIPLSNVQLFYQYHCPMSVQCIIPLSNVCSTNNSIYPTMIIKVVDTRKIDRQIDGQIDGQINEQRLIVLSDCQHNDVEYHISVVDTSTHPTLFYNNCDDWV